MYRTKQGWITIESKAHAKTILYALADDDKRNILMTLVNNPKSISEVLTKCKIPKTSGYRKINSLIHAGLIRKAGSIHNENNKQLTTYVSMFSDLKIDFVKREAIVKIRPKRILKNN